VDRACLVGEEVADGSDGIDPNVGLCQVQVLEVRRKPHQNGAQCKRSIIRELVALEVEDFYTAEMLVLSDEVINIVLGDASILHDDFNPVDVVDVLSEPGFLILGGLGEEFFQLFIGLC